MPDTPSWLPIESAPRGSGEDGPSDTRDPAYVEPPKLLLWTQEGPVVGYYDWYYHPGYGRGAEPGESAWRDSAGGKAYGPTHWMPLPPTPGAPPSPACDGVSAEPAVPLTIEQIKHGCMEAGRLNQWHSFYAGASFAERHHGIGRTSGKDDTNG